MNSHNLDLRTNSYQAPLTQSFALAGLQVLPELNRIEDQRTKEQTAMEPRLMNLLCFLAANQGCVVDRDTLVEKLWPKVVVNENSLTRAVSELRKHLRRKYHGTSIRIETIPKKGYRLLALGQENSSRTTDQPDSLVNLGGIKRWVRHTPKALAGAALAASLGLFALMPLLANLKQGAPVSFADELIALQPSYLGGEVKLSASDLPSSRPSAIPATTRPVISHDGASFAYLRYDSSGSTVFFGTLSETVDPQPVYHDGDKLVNLAWSPTGDNLLFAKYPAMTTTALFSGQGSDLELLSLNPLTRELQRLVEAEVELDSDKVRDQNLT
jgi:DNA-binding winged helix-turn-helix (wHTH) protein